MRVILTGGGTAGHIWPIVSICNQLKKHNHSYLCVCSKNDLDKRIAFESEIDFKAISVGKMRNYFSLLNIIDPFKTLVGLIESFFIIKNFRPDVIFSKGGYVAAPVLFWAKIMKIPTVAHESDAVIGKATRWASGFARKICTGFPLSIYNFDKLDKEKFIYTGIPIRLIYTKLIKENQIDDTILITGGSQGSSKINNIVMDILEELTKKYKIIHLTGDRDFSKFSAIKKQNYQAYSFSQEMPKLLAKSKLVITRSGSTLAEIAYLGKASILIPLSTSSLNHQVVNAQYYKNNKAAEIILENDLTGQKLLDSIDEIMSNRKRLNELELNIKSLSKPNASGDIVDILEKVAGK